LFETFVNAGKQNSLGPGLALSRQTVFDRGGDIWMEPAGGARFVIRLPLQSHYFFAADAAHLQSNCAIRVPFRKHRSWTLTIL
jgi:K+-sensing histidine kinase KdpD